MLNFPLYFKVVVSDGQRVSAVAYSLKSLLEVKAPLARQVASMVKLEDLKDMQGKSIELESGPRRVTAVTLLTEKEFKNFGKKKK